MPDVLVVDDEPAVCTALRLTLEQKGFAVETAHNGREALRQLCARSSENRPYDAIILDIVMPRLDGLQVCHRLRRDPKLAAVPILFLTVRGDAEARVKGLEQGADDYMSKPFDLRELKARVRSLLRRSHTITAQVPEGLGDTRVLIVGSLVLDLNTYQARVGDRAVPITRAEFDVLRFLMTHPGQVFPSQTLLERVWGYLPGSADPGLVRWHIRNLRAKLELDPGHPTYIRTMPHRGYILASDQSLSPPEDGALSQRV